jgi:hypothetical protein
VGEKNNNSDSFKIRLSDVKKSVLIEVNFVFYFSFLDWKKKMSTTTPFLPASDTLAELGKGMVAPWRTREKHILNIFERFEDRKDVTISIDEFPNSFRYYGGQNVWEESVSFLVKMVRRQPLHRMSSPTEDDPSFLLCICVCSLEPEFSEFFGCCQCECNDCVNSWVKPAKRE